jgi:hypothetical protein
LPLKLWVKEIVTEVPLELADIESITIGPTKELAELFVPILLRI